MIGYINSRGFNLRILNKKSFVFLYQTMFWVLKSSLNKRFFLESKHVLTEREREREREREGACVRACVCACVRACVSE